MLYGKMILSKKSEREPCKKFDICTRYQIKSPHTRLLFSDFAPIKKQTNKKTPHHHKTPKTDAERADRSKRFIKNTQ